MSADDLAAAKKAIDSWYMGKTSAIHESGGSGPGTISTGKDDLGGASYGIYQLSSKMGTLREYLDQSPYGQYLSGLRAAGPEFNVKWQELATNDLHFGHDQHDFIKRSHVDIQVNSLKSVGLDLSSRGRAVQDAIWSTSVQFRHKTPNIFLNGIKEKFGNNFKLDSLSDSDIVEAIQDYKIAHNNSLFKSSSGLWPGLLRRANAEKAELVALANYEVTLAKHNQLPDWRLSNHLPDFRFPNGDATIGQLQLNLNQLGLAEVYGPLVADGKAGGPNSRTSVAIAAFKQQHGLTEPMSHAELLMATQVALRVKQSLDFDRPVREGFPGPAPMPHMISGMPDYLLSGRNAPSQTSVSPVVQTIPAAPAMHTPPPLRSGPALAPQHHHTPPPAAEPAALPPLPTTQTLEPGDRGAAVQALQQHLQLLGATDRYGQKIQDDRDYGERTREAVEQFQLWTGREPTGIADPDTLQAVQSQAQFALWQRAQGLAIASDAHLADHLRPIVPERVDAAIGRPIQGRNQARPAPDHDADPHPGARSAAISAPSHNGPERKSEPESAQPQPRSPHEAQAFPTGHRDYALFEAIRQQLPDEYSDDMAAHATLEARKGGINRPDQIRGMAIENGQLTIMGKSGMDFAFVELTASAPPLQETLQQSAAFDQQQTIQLAQFHEQQQQMNMGRGPSMTL